MYTSTYIYVYTRTHTHTNTNISMLSFLTLTTYIRKMHFLIKLMHTTKVVKSDTSGIAVVPMAAASFAADTVNSCK